VKGCELREQDSRLKEQECRLNVKALAFSLESNNFFNTKNRHPKKGDGFLKS